MCKSLSKIKWKNTREMKSKVPNISNYNWFYNDSCFFKIELINNNNDYMAWQRKIKQHKIIFSFWEDAAVFTASTCLSFFNRFHNNFLIFLRLKINYTSILNVDYIQKTPLCLIIFYTFPFSSSAPLEFMIIQKKIPIQ